MMRKKHYDHTLSHEPFTPEEKKIWDRIDELAKNPKLKWTIKAKVFSERPKALKAPKILQSL